MATKLFLLIFSCIQISLIVGQSPADFQRCKGPMNEFTECMRPNIKLKREGRKQESSPQFRTQVATCFQRNGCQLLNPSAVPNDVSAASQQKIATFKAWWDSVPKEQQNCVMDTLKDEFVDSLNTCIGKQIAGYTLPVPQDKKDHKGKHNKPKGTHDDQSKSASLKDTIEASNKPCPKRDVVKRCIDDLKKPINKKSCDLRQTCDAKLTSENCKATSDRLKQVACECITQNKAAIREKFNGFKTAQALGPFSFLSGAQNQRMKEKVDSCGVKVPPNVVSAGGDLPDELLTKAGKYADNMAQREVGFCKGCEL